MTSLCRLTALVALVVLAMVLSTGSAAAEGSKSIAGAPAIPFGSQQFGNLSNGAVTQNSCGADIYTEWWALNVSAGDRVRIDWEAQQLEYTTLLVYPFGTTDYTYPNTDPLEKQELNSNNKNQAIVTATNNGTLPVAFTSSHWSCLSGTPGPYDFTAYIQHALAIALKPYTHIRTSTVIRASANLINGAPIPDGLVFNLTVSWPDRESVSYSAASAAGAVAFQLALPETAKGKTASLVVSRPEDSQYLAAASAEVKAKVGRGPVPATNPCAVATHRIQVLARQHRRLGARSRAARGARKRHLRHRFRRVGRKLRTARANASEVCGA